jgi:hypothetical protein
MKQPCGCCTGLEVVTPETEANRPGLSALAYRAGTYATFLESMLARISSIYLDVPVSEGSGKLQRIFPLNGLVLNGGKFERVSAGLSTRELNDPSIALLDAWATVADVLTFYEERIANEGYLRTATQRRSILELARQVGYRLRPGISSSVYLAFTVSDGFKGIIPSGSRAQSIPVGTGEKPQPFETYVDLPARDVWNNLKPRLTRPQVITLGNDNPLDPTVVKPFEPGFDARTRVTLYFKGIATNLKPGDALLIVAGNANGQQAQRFIASVDAQQQNDRTEVVLQEPLPAFSDSGAGGAVGIAVANLKTDLCPFLEQASTDFPGADLASQVVPILSSLLKNAPSATSATAVGREVQDVIPQIEELRVIAAKRKFTRLEPWLADLIGTLNSLAQQIPGLDGDGFPASGGVILTQAAATLAPTALAHLSGILDSLALAPSLQPRNSFRLTRTIGSVFSPQSDIAPRLIATLRPAVAPLLYPAWSRVEPTPTSSPVQVYALRAKTAPFGNNAPAQPKVPARGGGPVTYAEWKFSDSSKTDLTDQSTLYLESVNDKIVPGSWVVITRTDPAAPKQPFITTVKSVRSVSRADYLMGAKVTQSELDQKWLTGLSNDDEITVLRKTTVWAQSELLELAEEPLDRDVEGNTIELNRLYDGLESGRWIVVSGPRTDIPNVSGVTSSELVMIGSVNQGPGKQSCLAFSTTTIPFTRIYYVTDPNLAGDRLVVGVPAASPDVFLKSIPNPDPNVPNQQICDPLQLAPGFYANAYVPTKDERDGTFRDFAKVFLDPDSQSNHAAFPGGRIPKTPTNRRDPADPNNPAPVFAWRIRSVASGSETAHTTIVLAKDLAYKYDAEKGTIYGNVVKATHGQTQGEVLGSGDASQGLQKFQLHQSPLTYLPAPTPSGADSTLTLRVNEIEWQETDNLFVLEPSDREYITQTDDSDKTTAITGNGEHGLRVPTGTANVKAVYRSGTGKVGNVHAQQISQLATQPLGAKSVINPLPAAGGADGDTRDQARRNVPIGIAALDRLVSVPDYADFACKFAGIGKASARRLTDRRRLLVHLTIAGKDDIPIDPTTDLYQALAQALAQAGDPNQPVEIALRRLKVLVITAGVKVQPSYTWESVAANLRSALLDQYSFDRRELGQSAFMSEAVSTMQAVAGVQYVDMHVFDSVSESVTAEELASLARTLSSEEPKSFVEADLAHVDPSEVDPARRIQPAELVILTPDIPDTLILTEITQ